MPNELLVPCPECNAIPGVACGVASHPERIASADAHAERISQRHPEKPESKPAKKNGVHHEKVHLVKKHRRVA
jgi:hypothetical protein